MLDEARHYREQLIEKVSEADDKILEKYLHGEDISEDEIKARAAQARQQLRPQQQGRGARSCRSSAGRPSRTKAFSRCSTRSSTSCPRRSTCPSIAGIDPDKKVDAEHPDANSSSARRSDDAPFARAGVQDHDRPVRRPADVLPRLLGRADRRLERLQLDQAAQRAHRPAAEDARQQARRDQGGLRRRHRRGSRVSRASRPATRSATRSTRSCSSRWTSPSRSSRWRSSRRPRSTRRSSAPACRS